MNEKIYDDGTKATKTPIMLYYAIINNNILWIHPWQNESQLWVSDFWSRIMSPLSGTWLQAFLNEILAGFTVKRESNTLPAPF
jgi:hypothetical protein